MTINIASFLNYALLMFFPNVVIYSFLSIFSYLVSLFFNELNILQFFMNIYMYFVPYITCCSIIYNVYDGIVSTPTYFHKFSFVTHDGNQHDMQHIYAFDVDSMIERILLGFSVGLLFGICFPVIILGMLFNFLQFTHF
jgi:hypothetical protein